MKRKNNKQNTSTSGQVVGLQSPDEVKACPTKTVADWNLELKALDEGERSGNRRGFVAQFMAILIIKMLSNVAEIVSHLLPQCSPLCLYCYLNIKKVHRGFHFIHPCMDSSELPKEQVSSDQRNTKAFS